MKLILCTAILFMGMQLFAQISVFGNPYFDQSVTQTEINNAGPVFSQQTVLFPSTQTFLFNGTSQKEIRATDNIKIQTGFKSGTYTGTGNMKLTVQPSPFDVAVMNYATGVQHVLRYEKLELGVVLPTDIATKVNNFVLPDAGGIKLNPYLDWELRVYAVFTHPDEAQPIIIDGFYTKEFTSWMVDPIPDLPETASCFDNSYDTLGGYNEVPTNYPFRIRFAPPRNGVWKAKIVIATANGTVEVSSSEFEFNVFENGNPGYMKVGANKRYLTLNGSTFIPIGCNAMAPETNSIFDPEFAQKTHINWTGLPGDAFPCGESYRYVTAKPRVYDKYKEVLIAMADNGANYFRTIMNPYSTEIEWKKLGDYTSRLSNAQEMDEILELAEDRDFYLQWNFQQHTVFKVDPGNTIWDWNRPDNLYCYSDTTNGSVLAFLTGINADNTPNDAKKHYKQRLRYILARWGYSTNISVFELVSEIDQFGTNIYHDHVPEFVNWMVEMATYVKSQYNGKIHLFTSCYAGKKDNTDNAFNYPQFDLMSSNIYDSQQPSFSDHFNFNVSKQMLNDWELQTSYTKTLSPSTSYNIKPLMFSEMDPIAAKSPLFNSTCGSHVEELKRSMWQSLFSGLAGGLSWDTWYYPELYPSFLEMRNFVANVDFDGGAWHPGASQQWSSGSWSYNSEFEALMGKNKRLDVSYLRSGDGNFVIGVITNKTFNSVSNSNCFVNEIWINPDSLGGNWTNTSTSTQDWLHFNGAQLDQQDIELKGLNADKYYINYFQPSSNYGTPIHSSDDTQLIANGSIKLNYNVPATSTGYIIPFMARRSGQSWSPLIQPSGSTADLQEVFALEENLLVSTNLEESSTIDVYPVPTSSELFIELQNLSGITITIETFDGRQLKKLNLDASKTVVSLVDFASGTYILRCFKDGVLLKQQKIVKL